MKSGTCRPENYVLKAWHKKLKMKTGAVRVTVVAGETATVDVAITTGEICPKP